jgi:putative hydrolase of the HAD superfamily
MKEAPSTTIHGEYIGRRFDVGEVALALRAVIFDYGRVLTGPPDPAAHAALLRITGLSADRFDNLYWTDRQAYDEGKLTGLEFWRKLLRDAGLSMSESAIAELNLWDARMWTRGDPAMLAWQLAIKRRGLLTAIVSNMGDSVHEHMVRELDWLSHFDVLVWSYQLRVAKPDPAIYLYALERLGTRPEETLFIDDKVENVEAAIALGMRGLIFSTVEQLRLDLIDSGLSGELPLP